MRKLDEREQETLVRRGLPVARDVIRKAQYGVTQSQFDDIESDGMLGLLRSTASWSGEGPPPSGWIAVGVQRAIVDGQRLRLGRINENGISPRAVFNSTLSLDASPDDSSKTTLGNVVADPNDRNDIIESRADLIQALDVLPWKERHAIARVYLAGHKLREVGDDWGVTESRISQICSAALLKLRERMDAED